MGVSGRALFFKNYYILTRDLSKNAYFN